VEFGEGCPLPNRAGVWGGALIFFNCLPRNGAFFEHSDTIRQFTRPVAIRLKACKKRRRPYFPTKFGMRSFIRSKVMEGVPNFKFRSRDPDHARFYGSVCCALATCTKYEVPIFNYSEDIRVQNLLIFHVT